MKITTKVMLTALTSMLVSGAMAQCPTITCPSDTTLNNDPGVCSAVVNYGAPVTDDQCAAGPGTVLFVCDSDNTTATEIPAELTAAGYTVVEVYSDHNATTKDNATLQGSLAGYDVIFWHASGSSGYGDTHSAATFTNLTTFVNGGGAIFITGYDVIASPTDMELITFMGGTSSTDGGSAGTETLVGANSLTTGVTNIVGLTLNNTGDHDGLNGLTAGTVGVATNGTSHGWSIRTLGAGEIAWVSTANYIGMTWAAWNTPGSGYNEALLNFAFNHSAPSPIVTMLSGMASGDSFPVGTTTVTYEVTDWQGNNPATCSFDVTVLSSIDTAVTQNGGMLSATPQLATFQWLDCDNSFMEIAGAVNQYFDPGMNGSYAVEITNADGCVDTSYCYVLDYTGVTELNADGVSVYPNPSTGIFTVELFNLNAELITVVDQMGRVIYSGEISSVGKNEIDLSGTEPGLYFVNVMSESGMISYELVIE